MSVLTISEISYAEKSEFSKQTESLRKLNTTPLIRGENYNSYVEIDKELNGNYKLLLKKLDKYARASLKSTQLEWLKWRDEKCDKMQEKIECGTAGCYGGAHDDCILQMTYDRSEELLQFNNNIKEAISKKFQFSRTNKYLDD